MTMEIIDYDSLTGSTLVLPAEKQQRHRLSSRTVEVAATLSLVGRSLARRAVAHHYFGRA